MSKELEALKDLEKRNNALKEEGHFHIGETTMNVIRQALNELETLRAKEVLFKVIVKNEIAFCKCGNQIFSDCDFNYCGHCGQKLDWSDEYE